MSHLEEFVTSPEQINSVSILSEIPLPPETMSLDIALLRYQADNIPPFDGNPKILQRFLCTCENFLRTFQNAENVEDPINVILLDTVLNKLRGRAADLIGSRSELNSWYSIKAALNLTFSDQRGIDCLIQDLISIKPQKNETPMNFGMRIQDARSLLFAKLSSLIVDDAERRIKIAHYDDFALKTFLSGLPYHMQLVVRLKNPRNLEEALAFTTEEENFLLFSNNRNQNTIHNSSRTPQFQNYSPINSIRPSNTPNHPITSFRRPPFMPFNLQHRPMTSTNIFASKPQTNNFPFRPTQFLQPNNRPFAPRPSFPNQNFRPPMNRNPQFSNQNNYFPRNSAIFKTQTQNNDLNKVTPMDTSSGNTVIPHRPHQPRFTFEELYAQQINDDNYHPDIPTEYLQYPEQNTEDPNFYPEYYNDNYYNSNYLQSYNDPNGQCSSITDEAQFPELANSANSSSNLLNYSNAAENDSEGNFLHTRIANDPR